MQDRLVCLSRNHYPAELILALVLALCSSGPNNNGRSLLYPSSVGADTYMIVFGSLFASSTPTYPSTAINNKANGTN